MDTIIWILPVIGIFIVYLSFKSLRSNRKSLLSWLALTVGLIMVLYAALEAMRFEVTDNETSITDKQEAAEEIEAKKPVEKETLMDFPAGGFEGDTNMAKYQANQWYIKAVGLWDVNSGMYTEPDSVLLYTTKALYYYVFPEAYDLRGRAKVQMAKINEGVKDYDEALKLAPKQGTTYFNRGTAYYIMNDMGRACDDWKKAYELGMSEAAAAIATYCR